MSRGTTYSQGFTLDAAGNMATVTTNGNAVTRTTDAANEIQTISGSSNPTYDAAGNMTFDGTLAYKYDAWGRLVAVYNGSLSGNQVAAYSYDGLGRRIQTKTYTDGTLSATQDYYLNQSDQVVVNFGQGGAASDTWYLWGVRNVQDLVLYVNSDDGAYRVLQDANWNVTALADAASGAVLERYYYSAYGAATVCNPDWTAVSGNESQYGNTVLFAGMDLDPATGLYYDRARWYSPSLGVFTTQDPAQADPNLYRYCGNSPATATDPTGLRSVIRYWQLFSPGGVPDWTFEKMDSFTKHTPHDDAASVWLDRRRTILTNVASLIDNAGARNVNMGSGGFR